MVASEIHIRKKGQMTLPAGLREKLGVSDGDRIIGEFVDGRIILTRPEDDTARTAGALAKDVTASPIIWDRDDIWGEMAKERDDRIHAQVAEESEPNDSH